MLKQTLLASTGLLLSGSRILEGATRPAVGNAGNIAAAKRVVVVGAGFAGLACAYELVSAGYDVTVIEARNRVGGRVLSFSDFVPGKNVEGGAELIGSNHPTWVSYTEKFGFKFLDLTEEEGAEAPIILGGQRLNLKESEELWEQMESAGKLLSVDAAKVNEDEPWTTPDAAAYDKRSVQDWISKLDVGVITKQGFATQLNADNGVNVTRQSLLGLMTAVKGGGLDKYWTETEVYRLSGGNQQLAFKLADGIGKNRVVLNLAVKSIKAQGNNMVVTCADGRTLEVDDVVLAIPPSLWKKIDIQPPLPAALNPQMGSNVKYLVSLKRRFWKDHKLAPDSMTDGDVSMTWEGTDNQPGESGFCMVAFSGAQASENCRNRSKEARQAAYANAIEMLYPGYKENFVNDRFMDWPSDPLTLASYSFPAPGQVTTVGPILYKGIGKLHFAGEHACYKFAGYMEGALNSGVSLAKRLATRDGAAK